MSSIASLSPVVTGSYTIDPVHSHIGFSVKHMGAARFRSQFAEVDGTLAPNDTGELVLEGHVPVSSLAVHSPEGFRAHLLSGDFFDITRHPSITFVSDSVELHEGHATVTGHLTINGQTIEVQATGEYDGPYANGQGEVLALNLETTIDRRDVGLTWNAELPGGRLAVAWPVTLEISLELSRA